MQRVHQICQAIKSKVGNPVTLPNGGILTIRRFQQLGLFLGINGGFEQLHYLLLDAFSHPISKEIAERELYDHQQTYPYFSYKFLCAFQNILPFETNPLYAVLHESIYCQGKPSLWSAKRVLEENSQFRATFEYSEMRPFYFTGEMIFDWMFDDYSQLAPFKEAAEILAKKSDWPQLYDMEKLSELKVPLACVVYHDDMYVDFNLSVSMARPIPSSR